VTFDCHYCTCLGHLGQQDTKRNHPICAVLPKVAKVSTYNVAANDVIAKKLCQCILTLMEQYICFRFLLVTESATEKGTTIYNATEVSLQQKMF
jgi:hypothetical protein